MYRDTITVFNYHAATGRWPLRRRAFMRTSREQTAYTP
nr:MAG TPA: hypothetical protein [Caudoviricetes sp.]